MIKFIVSVGNNAVFNNYIGPCIKQLNVPTCIVQNSDNIVESIFDKYNKGIDALQRTNGTQIASDDAICFVHEDVKIIDPYFMAKVSTIFEQKPDVGLLGCVGTTHLYNHCAWYLNESGQMDRSSSNLHGHLMQELNNQKPYESVFGKSIGYYDDLCVVDGFFIVIRGDLINRGLRFDNAVYSGYDFYDLDICMQVLEMGYKIAVADILMLHKSEGAGVNKPNWQVAKFAFQEKWKKKGKRFPITTNQFKHVDLNKPEKINEDVTVIEI